MARGRMISKSLSTSQRFADLACRAGELGEFCQSLYPLIVSHADDFGRLQGDPFTVKHQCHPTSPRSIAEFTDALRLLHEVGLIVWFSVGNGSGTPGRHYIQVVNFEAHQQGLHKRTRSGFPRVPDDSGNSTELPSQLKGRELNLTKGNLTKENRSKDAESSTALTRAEPTAPALLTFPTIGVHGTSWAFSDSQLAEWQQAYPGLDVFAEVRKALVWVQANQSNRKTAKGMPRFLVSWLNRATNSRRSATPAASTNSPKTDRLMRSSQEFLKT